MVARNGPGRPQERHRASIDVVVVAPQVADLMEVVEALAVEGLHAERLHQPEAVAGTVVRGRPDVIILDLREHDPLAHRMLTWVSRNANCAVLVVTSVEDVDSRLRALSLGANDHVVAPFDAREAVARVQALISQRRSGSRTRIEVGDLAIDAVQRCATRGGETVSLTPREVDLLVTLVANAEKPLSKHELLQAVWGDELRSENVVEANISSLRRKLHGLGPPVIHTVHRTGYVFRQNVASPVMTRAVLMAERERVLRHRDEAVARRDELVRRYREEEQRDRRRPP